jgi:tetrahydromethanopterin S-methyltransferase subunit A
VLKVKPPEEYPPEEGRYARGNDYSPVAVCVILNTFDFKIPDELEELVIVALDAGAALAGMLPTENIGIEKMVCNLVANPNIRYLAICGEESPGHLVGDTVIALATNGLDEKKRIIDAKAPTPYLYNLPPEVIERFRQQITVLDLVGCTDTGVISEAVMCCYQEELAYFSYGMETYWLHDLGAFGEPLLHKLMWKVKKPWLVQGERKRPTLAMKEVVEARRNPKRRGIMKYLSGVIQARKAELRDIFALSEWELNFHLGMLRHGNFVDIYEDVVMITEEGEYLTKMLKGEKE